jgi:hypothetical protein
VIVAARHDGRHAYRIFAAAWWCKLKGRPEQLVVSRNYADLFRQM